MYKETRNLGNMQLVRFDGVAPYGIPPIEPDHIEPCEMVGFNYAKSCKDPGSKGLHFFVDDYQFERVWNSPARYLDMLSRFAFVCSPDFSMYTDMPAAMQIWNHYRKHWLGAYWQMLGIPVVPTIGWSDESSFEWCFDGEPKRGTVAVSAVGTQGGKATQDRFMRGYQEMMRRLEPKTILFYGRVPEGCEGNIVQIPAYQEKMRQRLQEADNGR